MSGLPPKSFSDGSPTPSRGDDADRSFQWYKPEKRRATVYEDVTVDTQPSVHRHVDRGWQVCFEDGRGTWSDDSTLLKSTDWYEFRDPAQLWERTYFQQGAGYERQIENALNSARDADMLADFSPEWIEFMRANLQIGSFVDHGLWLATATSARDCLSDGIATCVVIEAAMKQRQAQASVLYAMDLEDEFGPFDIAPCKAAFLEDEAWQPTRQMIERLRATADWGEVIFVANCCIEPLVVTLLRRELLMRGASANGDIVTPALSTGAQLESEWIRDWTAALIQMVLGDQSYGQANREVLERWTSDWLPEARAAAEALAPVFDQVPSGADFPDALASVFNDQDELLKVSGLAAAEVAQ